MEKIIKSIQDLVAYGLRTGLIQPEDKVYAANLLLDLMHTEPDSSFCADGGEERPLEDILKDLLDEAVRTGIIEDGVTCRDLFDTRLMSVLTPRPSEVIRTFDTLYQESPEKATDYFYALSKNSDYVRSYRIVKDRKWKVSTDYGDLDITINLSKPEKDPKAIAAALTKKQDSYPKCLLCRENEGYAGRLDHPARQTIRLIPLELEGSRWFMQYSPYSYYNEHCIILSENHAPMKIDHDTFARLLAFTEKFPHYMLGSNADLPIVGGSILTHEHFQGGRYTFAMAKAPVRHEFTIPGYEDIQAGIVKWPMSVIRLDGADRNRLADCAQHILETWIDYDDPSADIISHTDGVRHNTITPIARRKGDLYEIDLVLRNNRTTDEYPMGIFHPHAEYHHIKRENIGLIEVMGLAILPARLLKEMDMMAECMIKQEDPNTYPDLEKHAAWLKDVNERHDLHHKSRKEIEHVLEQEIGIVFSHVLENAGVFKNTEEGMDQFDAFTRAL